MNLDRPLSPGVCASLRRAGLSALPPTWCRRALLTPWLLAAASVAAPLVAQSADSVRRAAAGRSTVPAYPVAPTPVLDPKLLPSGPAFSGYVSVRQTRRNDSTTVVINRARITLMGAPRPALLYRIQADLSAAGRVSEDSTVPASVLTDAFVQLTAPVGVDSAGARSALTRLLAATRPALIVGQFRTPFSLEYLTPFSLLKTATRSQVVDRLSTRRDIGALTHFRLGEAVTLLGAVANGEGPNATRNSDATELVLGRLTVRPLGPTLAIAGKWAGQGRDHLWGYDLRWVWRAVTLEGEAIHRTGRHPGATVTTAASAPSAAGGGYVLAAFRLLDWLEPVVKWEQFHEETSPRAGEEPASETWVTTGTTVHTPDDHLRFQLNWVIKETHPVQRHVNELVVQLLAIY